MEIVSVMGGHLKDKQLLCENEMFEVHLLSMR